MNIEEKIADFIFNFSLEELSQEALNTIKNSLLDSIGVALAGVNEEAVEIIFEIIKEYNYTGNSTVIGKNYKSAAPEAALINGVSLHVLDFDDTGAYTQGHPSAPIFSTVLALAEENHNSGRDILEAYTVGVEIFSRISRGMPMLHLHGWHPTSIIGSLASTSAASKLLNLSVNEIKAAFSIASSMSSGLIKNFGTMTKSFQVGNSARNGIIAAKLACKGFSASKEIFNTANGFVSTFMKVGAEKLHESIKKIGNPLAVAEPGINIKKYPSCSLTHRIIDAVLLLKEKNNIVTEKIEKIECNVPPRALKVLAYNNPSTELEAKFSLQFIVATTILYGFPNLNTFSRSSISDESVRKLMKKIKVSVHKDWIDGDDARADIVTITNKDGTVLSEGVKIPKGNVNNPLSKEQIREKFINNTERTLSKKNQSNIIDSINKFEFLDDISGFMKIIAN